MADQLSLQADVVVELGEFRLDVALDVAPGATLALTGPNGAGKTSLLRTLAGVQPLDSGRIVMGEVVLDEPSSRTWVAPAKRHIGFVFQDHRLFPSMSAVENVAFGLRARGIGRRAAQSLAHKWVNTVGLAERSGVTASDLSGGQAQRVALARALATDPSLVLLDEPFSSVDESSRAKMIEVLGSLETTTLIATHDQEVVSVLADGALSLVSGRES